MAAVSIASITAPRSCSWGWPAACREDSWRRRTMQPGIRVLTRLAALALVLRASDAGAMCWPIPCTGCAIASYSQQSLVVMDRAHGQVHLVPNIVVQGLSPSFVLIVPTPSQPDFTVAPRNIWNEIGQLTSLFPRQRGGDQSGLG